MVAAVRLPFTFVLVLVVDALALVLADQLVPRFGEVSSFGDALLAALVMAATSIVLRAMLGTDDDEYALRVVRRVARRKGTKHLPLPGGPIVGAAAVHDLLLGWRRMRTLPPAVGRGGRDHPLPRRPGLTGEAAQTPGRLS
jgi:hypothetical protein